MNLIHLSKSTVVLETLNILHLSILTKRAVNDRPDTATYDVQWLRRRCVCEHCIYMD